MGDKGGKRQASPLESQIIKRRTDKVYASQGSSRAWITVEKSPARFDVTMDKINTRSKQKQTGTRQQGQGGQVLDPSCVMDSLRNLESLYAGIKKEMHTIHIDLDRKLDVFMKEQSILLETIEKLQHGQELEINKVNEKLEFHDEKLCKLNSDLSGLKIDDIRSTVGELKDKMEVFERNLISERKGFTEEQGQVIYDMARKLEYHESRLKRHEGKFLDVFSELRDKAININGLTEEPNENLIGKVLDNRRTAFCLISLHVIFALMTRHILQWSSIIRHKSVPHVRTMTMGTENSIF